MPTRHHEYAARVIWAGNSGRGTDSYAGYTREYRVLIAGKPALAGTADTAFHGDPRRHHPEDLFLAALSACHLLTYLALCARRGVCVVAYEDDALGTLVMEPRGGGQFTRIVLRPRVSVLEPEQLEPARQLHDEAHAQCFIAASCRVPVHVRPTIVVAGQPRVEAAMRATETGSTRA
jgi:organic hydroperoxide reductase OsmC/OhrA